MKKLGDKFKKYVEKHILPSHHIKYPLSTLAQKIRKGFKASQVALRGW